jgi:hypothetical protein
MEYRSMSDVAKSARLSSQIAGSVRSLRRERLERLANLLDSHEGPIRVLKRMEHLSASDRAMLRADPSPLTIAFHDPVFRAQGLASDRLGDARDFFALSEGASPPPPVRLPLPRGSDRRNDCRTRTRGRAPT